MKEPTRFEINGRVYIIGDWIVDKQLEVLVWLTQTFGEGILNIFMSEDSMDGINNLLEGKKEAEEGEEISPEERQEKLRKELEAISTVMQKLTKNLKAKEYVAYIKSMLEGVKCDGKSINFALHFVGKIGELHQVVFRVLRHQYSDFLGGSTVGEQ